MKSSILLEIQDTVIKYADVISNVINADVEIVDRNLVRVAGTGIYKNEINKDISKEGYIYEHVMKTGEKQVIRNAGVHKLCSKCAHKENCLEKMLVSTPITLNDEIEGVIGIICLEEKQRKNFIENLESYLLLLDQICEFIVAKAYEYLESERNNSMIELLNQILDSMDKGVLVTNANNEIVQINAIARRQLKLTANNANQSIRITSTDEYIMGGEVYKVCINNKKFEFIGRIIPVYPLLPSYNKIFIFKEMKQAKHQIYEMTGGRPTIPADEIIGVSRQMIQLKDKIKKVACSKSTVLITGESGTGKELIARAVHYESDRRNKPFIGINCGAIPDTLLESELFGYVRGAFTGADPNGRIGKFELANSGVIFLDEIGDMPLYLQVKILRVLQERKIIRIGSNQLIDLDIRVIAATNKDLKALIKENKFREDLYYRLNVIPMNVLPLRDRKDDIELIMMNLVHKYNGIFNKAVCEIEEKAKEVLINYPWPGNVRELENTMEFMINMSGDSNILTEEMLPPNILENRDMQIFSSNLNNDIRTLKEIEEEYILKALDQYGYDTKGKQMAAKSLGIGIATLYRKMEGIKCKLSE